MGRRDETYRCAYGLNQHVPLHPRFTPAPNRCLTCSGCKNYTDPSLFIDTDCTPKTSTTDTVRDGWAVGVEGATALEAVAVMHELGRVPSEARIDAQR